MPFANYSLTKGGQLTIGQIRSPNYSALDGTGWTINKDGSATFYSISLPGFAAGVKVTFASTAPASPNTGDLWYNTADGLQVSQWNGSAWVPYQIGTAAIEGGAITPTLTAAGDTTNPNPYFAGGDTSSWFPFSGASLAAAATSGFQFPWAGQITTVAAQSFPGIAGPDFPVNVGDPAQVNGWFNTNADLYFAVAYYDSLGNFISNTSVTVPADAGTWQYFAIVGTVPAGAASAGLEVGFNTGSTIGTESAQATGLTVMTKVNGGLIEANTITAAQLAAGIVYAGIVNSTTITGVTINGSVFNGTNWIENSSGSFLYSGTPASGNLIASDAPAAGTDGFGNPYQAGKNVYGNGTSLTGIQNSSGEAVLFFMPDASWAFSNAISPEIFSVDTGSGTTESMSLQVNSGAPSGFTSRRSRVILSSGSPDGTTSVPHVGIFGGNNDTLIADFNPAGITAVQPGTSATLETWHTITLDTGWSTISGFAAPQYRMLPDGSIQFAGAASHASFTVNQNLNGSNPIPAAYRPATNHVWRTGNGGTVADSEFLTTGVIQGLGQASGSVRIYLDGVCGLN